MEDSAKIVPNRVLQLDGDMLCYECSGDDDQPLEYCIESFKTALEIRMAMAGAEYCNVHLTGGTKMGGSFNTALMKPLHALALRKWVQQYYKCHEEHGHKADACYHNNQTASDVIAQQQYKALSVGAPHLSIIMSKDNDLAMCSGLHCDWYTYEIKKVGASSSRLLGIVFSWLQMQGQRITSTVSNCLVMLSILVVALPSLYLLKRKKRRAARAILYLQRIAYGNTIAETNALVLSLDASTLAKAQRETDTMLFDIYGGNEAATIQHAILEGFRG